MRNTRYSAFLLLTLVTFVVNAQTHQPNPKRAPERDENWLAERLGTPGNAAFTEWTRSHAIVFKTVKAGHGFDDMEKLAETVGNARIVALGEATHGKLKHRIIEFLATKMGFTIFSSKPICPRLIDLMTMCSTRLVIRAS